MGRWKICMRCAFSVCLATVLLMSALQAQQLVLSEERSLPPLRQIDPAFHQQRVFELNERFDVLLLTSKSNRSLELAVLDPQQKLLWQRPSPSTWVVVSPVAACIALIGKSRDEGLAPTDGKTVYRGVTVLDLRGNTLYSIQDPSPIGRAELSADGPVSAVCFCTHAVGDTDPTGSRASSGTCICPAGNLAGLFVRSVSS